MKKLSSLLLLTLSIRLLAGAALAAEAYVSLLTKEYGFALTDGYLETEVATWRLEDASGKMIRLDYDQGDGRTP